MTLVAPELSVFPDVYYSCTYKLVLYFLGVPSFLHELKVILPEWKRGRANTAGTWEYLRTETPLIIVIIYLTNNVWRKN